MKVLIALISFSFAAQEALPDISMLDPIARIGAVGVLGFLLCWLHMRTLPTMAAEWREATDRMATEWREATERLAEALTELRIHCERQKQ